MNNKAERVITKISHYIIAVGVIFIVLTSANDIYFKAPMLFNGVLAGCLLFFFVEIIFRVFVFNGFHISYFITFRGIVEVLGVTLTPVAFALGADPQTAWTLSAVWILILIPDNENIRVLRRVLSQKYKTLMSVLVLFMIVLFLAATAVYLIEWEVQSETFTHIPSALWWAVTTLTTTGYGDMVPLSLFSRIIAGLVMFSGLGLFGVWTGILTTGFSAERKRENMLRIWEAVRRIPFFSGLNPAEIAEIAGFLHPIDLNAKTTIVRKGGKGDSMFFIAEGEVEVDLPKGKIRLGEGEFFGEMALLEHRTRSANVETTKITKLLSLDIIDFNQIISRYPEIGGRIREEARARAAQNNRGIRWRDELTLGVSVIDRQHRELFEKTGKLLDAISDKGVDHKRECIDAIHFLKDYAVRHFADEEAYQLSINHDGYKKHKKLHENFVKRVLAHEAKMTASDFARKDIEAFTGTLVTWLLYHVADADQKIGKETAAVKRMEQHGEIAFYCVCDALYKMAKFDITRMRERVVHTETFKDSLAVKVGLVGAVSGNITLVYPASFIRHLICAIMNFTPEQIGELEISALREVSNIISGSICNIIAENRNALCDITTPVVTQRAELLPDERVTIDTGHGILEVDLSIKYEETE